MEGGTPAKDNANSNAKGKAKANAKGDAKDNTEQGNYELADQNHMVPKPGGGKQLASVLENLHTDIPDASAMC